MQERPELEESRSALIVASAQMRRELKDIEDRILYRLSLSEGSAVDDVDLVLTLEASKVKSEEIKVHRYARVYASAPTIDNITQWSRDVRARACGADKAEASV